MSRNVPMGSTLDEFLAAEGTLEEFRAIAVREALAWQVEQAMKQGNISK